MNFNEWLEAYYSGTQIDDVITGMMRTAFEAGKCEAAAVGLRDKFAMAAMQGMLADHNIGGTIGGITEWAYKYADAMLKERKK
jgi:hypothetical protein